MPCAGQGRICSLLESQPDTQSAQDLCWWDSLVSGKALGNGDPFIPLWKGREGSGGERKGDGPCGEAWTTLLALDCSVCLSPPRPSAEPRQWVFRRASWDTTEPCMPSGWQTWQGPSWLLVTMVRPSTGGSTQPHACGLRPAVWHPGPPWPGLLCPAPRSGWWVQAGPVTGVAVRGGRSAWLRRVDSSENLLQCLSSCLGPVPWGSHWFLCALEVPVPTRARAGAGQRAPRPV